MHYLVDFLDLKKDLESRLAWEVGIEGLPCLGYKSHSFPSFQEPQIWGKAGSPKVAQTPGTFEQGGSPVNDLWIQGVSHLLREAIRPFRHLLLPIPHCTPALATGWNPESPDPL